MRTTADTHVGKIRLKPGEHHYAMTLAGKILKRLRRTGQRGSNAYYLWWSTWRGHKQAWLSGIVSKENEDNE